MAIDCFIEFKGGKVKIEGESQDESLKDKSEVLSWSWACNNIGHLHQGLGATTGKANFHDISLTMYVNKSANAIMKSCATGDHIGEVIIYQRRASGDKPVLYCKWTLTTVLITAVSTSGGDLGGPMMLSLNLHYAQMKFEYFPLGADGSQGAPLPFGYDIPANKVTA